MHSVPPSPSPSPDTYATNTMNVSSEGSSPDSDAGLFSVGIEVAIPQFTREDFVDVEGERFAYGIPTEWIENRFRNVEMDRATRLAKAYCIMLIRPLWAPQVMEQAAEIIAASNWSLPVNGVQSIIAGDTRFDKATVIVGSTDQVARLEAIYASRLYAPASLWCNSWDADSDLRKHMELFERPYGKVEEKLGTTVFGPVLRKLYKVWVRDAQTLLDEDYRLDVQAPVNRLAPMCAFGAINWTVELPTLPPRFSLAGGGRKSRQIVAGGDDSLVLGKGADGPSRERSGSGLPQADAGDLMDELEEANVRMDEANMRMDGAEMWLDHAEMRMAEADMRIDEADMRMDDAEMRMAEADMKIDEADMLMEYIESTCMILKETVEDMQAALRKLELRLDSQPVECPEDLALLTNEKAKSPDAMVKDEPEDD